MSTSPTPPPPGDVAAQLLAALPLVQVSAGRGLKASTVTELRVNAGLNILVVAIYLLTFGIYLFKCSKAAEPLWAVRRIRRDNGTYIIVNTNVFWLPAAACYAGLAAVTDIIRAESSLGNMSYRNFFLFVLLTNIPTAICALLISFAVFFSGILSYNSIKGSNAIALPSTWIFHLGQFGIPIVMAASVLTVALMGHFRFVKLVDTAETLITLITPFQSALPTEYTPELIQASTLAAQLTPMSEKVVTSLIIGVSIFVGWCGTYLLIFLPAGAFLSFGLHKAIGLAQMHTTNVTPSDGRATFTKSGKRSGNSGSSRDGAVAKHRLFILFMAACAARSFTEFAFGVHIAATARQSINWDPSRQTKTWWLNMQWAMVIFDLLISLALLVRTLQGDTTYSRESNSDTLAISRPTFNIQANTLTQVDADMELDNKTAPILLADLSDVDLTEKSGPFTNTQQRQRMNDDRTYV